MMLSTVTFTAPLKSWDTDTAKIRACVCHVVYT